MDAHRSNGEERNACREDDHSDPFMRHIALSFHEEEEGSKRHAHGQSPQVAILINDCDLLEAKGEEQKYSCADQEKES